jgi:glycosyltransferase involved in cell wall biosynthesis
MKVLFIVPNLVAGGAERQIIYLMRGLLERGFNPSIFMLDPVGVFLDEIPDRVKVYLPGSHRASDQSMNLVIHHRNPLKTIWQIIQVVCKEDPYILYSRHWPTKIPTAFAGWLMRKKVVLSEADSLMHSITYKDTSRRSSYVKSIACNLADVVVAVSQGVADGLKQFFKINSKVRVIHNGCDLEEIEKKSREEVSHPWFSQTEPIVLAVGRLANQKGFSYLLEAVKLVNSKVPVRLLIIGDGELKGRLEKHVEELGIKDKVEFLGVKTNPFAYMAKCDLFVLSSLYEGLPNALIEAMALGLPVISTNCPYGPGEIIEDGRNGILVPVGNPQAISEAILRVLGDKQLRDHLRTGAKRRAKHFSLDNMISKYIELFLSLSVNYKQEKS